MSLGREQAFDQLAESDRVTTHERVQVPCQGLQVSEGLRVLGLKRFHNRSLVGDGALPDSQESSEKRLSTPTWRSSYAACSRRAMSVSS